MKVVVHESKITFTIILAIVAILAALVTASARADIEKEPLPHNLPDKDTTKIFKAMDQLPLRLLEMHVVSIDEGQCTADLPEQLETVNAFTWLLEDGFNYNRFYAIPCARYGDNQSWKIYVESNETQKYQDGSGLFQRARLPYYDWTKRITGRDLVYMWIWEPTDQSISSIFLKNGRTDCGSRHDYIWDAGAQEFHLAKARLKADCDGQEGPWPEIK